MSLDGLSVLSYFQGDRLVPFLLIYVSESSSSSSFHLIPGITLCSHPLPQAPKPLPSPSPQGPQLPHPQPHCPQSLHSQLYSPAPSLTISQEHDDILGHIGVELLEFQGIFQGLLGLLSPVTGVFLFLCRDRWLFGKAGNGLPIPRVTDTPVVHCRGLG